MMMMTIIIATSIPRETGLSLVLHESLENGVLRCAFSGVKGIIVTIDAGSYHPFPLIIIL